MDNYISRLHFISAEKLSFFKIENAIINFFFFFGCIFTNECLGSHISLCVIIRAGISHSAVLYITQSCILRSPIYITQSYLSNTSVYHTDLYIMQSYISRSSVYHTVLYFTQSSIPRTSVYHARQYITHSCISCIPVYHAITKFWIQVK